MCFFRSLTNGKRVFFQCHFNTESVFFSQKDSAYVDGVITTPLLTSPEIPMKIYACLFALFFSLNSYSAIWGRIGVGKVDPTKRSHLIIAGTGHEEGGTVFQQAAVTKAMKYKELYPNDEIILLLNTEGGVKSNVAWLKARNVSIVEASDHGLTFNYILNVSDYFRTIASIDIYSHSAIKYGVQLSVGPDGNIFAHDVDRIKDLKFALARNAYVVFHGCNSGFILAPLFSEILEVPAFGSLSSTDFQEPLTDGGWYFNNTADKPEGMQIEAASKCKLGLCTRMKPRNAPYNGYWGRFSSGLSFYKLFCVQISKSKCLEGLARYTQDFVGATALNPRSSVLEYKKVVYDILCPIHAKTTIRQDCIASLNKAEADLAARLNTVSRLYNPMKAGDPLYCSLIKCYSSFVPAPTEKSPNAINVVNQAPYPNAVTTFVDEYARYLEAFSYLKRLD